MCDVMRLVRDLRLRVQYERKSGCKVDEVSGRAGAAAAEVLGSGDVAENEGLRMRNEVTQIEFWIGLEFRGNMRAGG